MSTINRRSNQISALAISRLSALKILLCVPLSMAFFFVVCQFSASTVKQIALVSVDMISTHYISDLILFLLFQITPDYLELVALTPGVRINFIFTNSNVFAGIAGIGVIPSLGLALSSVRKGGRTVHTSCLAMLFGLCP